ncbi:MAG: ribosome maturation factor RimP [Steroidobacteraceae bacterium]
MVESLRESLIALTEPLLARLGYELVDIEYAATHSEATLRVYVDWPDGKMPAATAALPDDGTRAFDGIGVEDCERVSRELSALLDVEDPIAVPYQLEVSSPGADRVLRTVAHYRRHVGQRVHVEVTAARDGRRRFTGELTRADDGEFALNVDESVVTVRYDEVGKTRLAPDWSRKKRRGNKK